MLRLALPRWQTVAAAPASTIPAAAPRAARHAPERTRLHSLVQAHYPEFIARFGAQDRSLPKYAPGDFGEAAIDLAAGPGALPTQDAVAQRHDARGV